MFWDPSLKDGQTLSNQQLTAITKDYLKGMGLEGHQYAAYVHQDKAHKHIHLFVNRVNEQGKAYGDSYIGKESQRAADRVSKSHGITRAGEVAQQKELGLKHTKKQIKDIHLKVMGTKPKSFEAYSKLMESKGVKIAPSINKQGAMQGFRAGLNKDTMLKASQVWKGMTLSKIQPIFALAKTITRNLGNELSR